MRCDEPDWPAGDDVECPFCWNTGEVTVNEIGREGNGVPVRRPCPEGCLTPDEVPF